MMIFRSLHLRFLLLIFAISANAAASAVTSDEQQQQQQQQPDEDIASTNIKPAGGPSSLRGPNINNRDLKKDIFVHECNNYYDSSYYDSSSNEQKLCKQIVAYSNGDGNKAGVIKNICKMINEIYDSVVVVDVIETAGLSLDDVLALPDGDPKACILAAYEMLPSSAPSDVPSLEPSATPSSSKNAKRARRRRHRRRGRR